MTANAIISHSGRDNHVLVCELLITALPEDNPRFVAALSTPKTEPFVLYYRRYDDWFERHRAAYLSELLAIRALLPWEGRGLEIGVGTGRFAGPLARIIHGFWKSCEELTSFFSAFNAIIKC
jgi:hypothetical protein